MQYCFYRVGADTEVRVGAVAPWDRGVIVDVNLAETAWLAERATGRRPYEIARHLVPADPREFLLAGAAVWDFSRDAVRAAGPDTTAPRGESVVVDLGDAVRVNALEHLARTAQPIGSPVEIDLGLSGCAAAGIISRAAYRLSERAAWDVVAAYIDVADDPTSIIAAGEETTTALRAAIARVTSESSYRIPLAPGDVICTEAAMAELSLDSATSSRTERDLAIIAA